MGGLVVVMVRRSAKRSDEAQAERLRADPIPMKMERRRYTNQELPESILEVMKTASTGITKMIHERTFADSNYKLYYDTARAPDFQHDLLHGVHKMVSLYAARTNPDKDIDELGVDVKVFMEDIQDDAFANDKA